MKSHSHTQHGTLTELNITPLLDLVFVLLVIFIITTPQLMNNVEMTLPSAKPPPRNPNQPEPKINHIVVSAQGEASLNGETLTVPALKQKLQQLKTADADVRVVVKAQDETDYQSMVTILDLLQQLEITKIGLATAAN